MRCVSGWRRFARVGFTVGALVALSQAIMVAAPATAASPGGSDLRAGRQYATLTVPGAGIRGLSIVRYPGKPDDGPGTVIQDRGIASAPYGKWGGVAPGQVGNFMLAAHRTIAGGPMRRVPALKKGQTISVRYAGKTYVYVVAYRLVINFRNARSKASQLAPVPGFPGVRATEPAIVLSTCATPEDAAAGLGWHDRYNNPTHRIDIVGFLQPQVASATTGPASSIASTSATVTGTVNPNAATTTVSFDYSTTPSFDPATTAKVAATPPTLTGVTATTVQASLTGLAPATNYYVRVVAHNSQGTTNGAVQQFVTAP